MNASLHKTYNFFLIGEIKYVCVSINCSIKGSHYSPCSLYVEEQLGHKYVEKRTIPFDESYKETGQATPVFFVLSPGVDPLKDVEAVGRKLGFTLDQGNFHNVSLGQVSYSFLESLPVLIR